MAVWQYSFSLVPTASIHVLNADTEAIIDGAHTEESMWALSLTDPALFEPFGALLKPEEPWDEHTLQFGALDKTYCEVVFGESKVLSVRLAVDMTDTYSELLAAVIEFCIFNGLSILDEQTQLLPLSLIALDTCIKRSVQFERLQDSKGMWA